MSVKVKRLAGAYACALLAALTAGCLLSDSNYTAYTHTDESTLYWSASGLTKLVAITQNGNVAVNGVAGDAITSKVARTSTGTSLDDARSHINDVVITESTAGGTLTLKATVPSVSDRDYSASYDMNIRKWLVTELTTASGSISVDSMAGNTTLLTSNGNVTVTSHTGTVIANCASGSVTCSVDSLANTDSISVSVTNGGVTVSVPATLSAVFHATTVNGTATVSGFSSITYTTNTTTSKSGTIGSGGPIIRASATNGNVVIKTQ